VWWAVKFFEILVNFSPQLSGCTPAYQPVATLKNGYWWGGTHSKRFGLGLQKQEQSRTFALPNRSAVGASTNHKLLCLGLRAAKKILGERVGKGGKVHLPLQPASTGSVLETEAEAEKRKTFWAVNLEKANWVVALHPA
jgi:hypothetical protein